MLQTLPIEYQGQPCRPTTLKAFRAEHHLPEAFSVAYFAPKNFAGKGSLENAAPTLRQLYDEVMAAVPESVPLQGWLGLTIQLQVVFSQALWRANAVIGLHQSEVEFAVANFSDVCQEYVYRLLRARSERTEPPDFDQVYIDWGQRSLLIADTTLPYEHAGEPWRVHLMRNVYGLTGLLVVTPTIAYAVTDTALLCPAEHFMYGLLAQIARRIHTSFTTPV